MSQQKQTEPKWTNGCTCRWCGGPTNITGNCPACDLKLIKPRAAALASARGEQHKQGE